jgi:tRNA(Ile)-lysidine synthase
VGHTRDDQAETILHRILRGTGPRGLAGMPIRRPLSTSVTLLRPLLSVSRQDIRDYLVAIGQGYHDDATNADLTRTRARIRHDLLPKLAAEYNPRVADALVRLGQLAGASARPLRGRLLEMERAATVSVDHDRVVLDREALRQLPRFLRAEVLRRVWRRAGWPEAGMGVRRWRRIATLAQDACARASVGGGIELECSPTFVTMTRPMASRTPRRDATVPLVLPGSVPWDGGRIVTTLDPAEPRDETIDLDSLQPPLWVRAPRPGDRFAPLGMTREKSLNDFFRGRRVPRDRRPHVPLVCDRLGIIWVVGHRIDQRVRRTERTGRTLGLRWEPLPDG